MDFEYILPERAAEIIKTRLPLGRFLTIDGELWRAIDNHGGEAWMGDFQERKDAIRWLKGNWEAESEEETQITEKAERTEKNCVYLANKYLQQQFPL